MIFAHVETGHFEVLLFSQIYMYWGKNTVSKSILICFIIQFLNALHEAFYLLKERNFTFIPLFRTSTYIMNF